MKREQTTNTFSEGLIMDLNPLVTPNNVLTNCLNGTIITFNGNEYVLQNDMGNGRVESAYLPEGYVPIGMKEHGGIIYVVSYNPLTNKGQLGSFPSPERNLSSSELSDSNTTISWDYNSWKDLIERYKVFKKVDDSIIIRSGDEFSIIFKSQDSREELSKYISNFDNINSSGQILSPKNKMVTFSVCVAGKNGILNDVTSSLNRYGDGNILVDTSELSDLQEFNTGYFALIQQPDEEKPPTTDDYRNSTENNVYNSKIFGELYLVGTLNTIENFSATFSGMKLNKEEKIEDLLREEQRLYYSYEEEGSTPFRITSGQESNINTWVMLEFSYQYNCPDNNYDSIDSPVGSNPYVSIKGIEGTYPTDYYIEGVKVNIEGEEKSIPFRILSSDYENYYNQNTNLYTSNQYIFINFANQTGIKHITITPYMKWGDTKLYLNTKETTLTIDLDKINSGTYSLNGYKYYYAPERTTLFLDLNAYPKFNDQIKEITLKFYKVNQATPQGDYEDSKTVSLSGRYSYSGTFNESFDNSELDYAGAYAVKILVKTEKNEEGELLGWRPYINSELDNSDYYNSGIQDFGSQEEATDITLVPELNYSVARKEVSEDHEGKIYYETANAKPDTYRIKTSYNLKVNYTTRLVLENEEQYPFELDYDKEKDFKWITLADELDYSAIITKYDRYGSSTEELTKDQMKEEYPVEFQVINEDSKEFNIIAQSTLEAGLTDDNLLEEKNITINKPLQCFSDLLPALSDNNKDFVTNGIVPSFSTNNIGHYYYHIGAFNGRSSLENQPNVSKSDLETSLNGAGCGRKENEFTAYFGSFSTNEVNSINDQLSDKLFTFIVSACLSRCQIILDSPWYDSNSWGWFWGGTDNNVTTVNDLPEYQPILSALNDSTYNQNYLYSIEVPLWRTDSGGWALLSPGIGRRYVEDAFVPLNDYMAVLTKYFETTYLVQNSPITTTLYTGVNSRSIYNDSYMLQVKIPFKGVPENQNFLKIVKGGRDEYNQTVKDNLEKLGIVSEEDKYPNLGRLFFNYNLSQDPFFVEESLQVEGTTTKYNTVLSTNSIDYGLITEHEVLTSDYNENPFQEDHIYTFFNGNILDTTFSAHSMFKVSQVRGYNALVLKTPSQYSTKKYFIAGLRFGNECTHLSLEKCLTQSFPQWSNSPNMNYIEYILQQLGLDHSTDHQGYVTINLL